MFTVSLVVLMLNYNLPLPVDGILLLLKIPLFRINFPFSPQAFLSEHDSKELMIYRIIIKPGRNPPFSVENKIPHVFIDNQWFNVEKLPIFSPFFIQNSPYLDGRCGLSSIPLFALYDLQHGWFPECGKTKIPHFLWKEIPHAFVDYQWFNQEKLPKNSPELRSFTCVHTQNSSQMIFRTCLPAG